MSAPPTPTIIESLILELNDQTSLLASMALFFSIFNGVMLDHGMFHKDCSTVHGRLRLLDKLAEAEGRVSKTRGILVHARNVIGRVNDNEVRGLIADAVENMRTQMEKTAAALEEMRENMNGMHGGADR